MEKVRLGFVGVGGMGQCAHLINYVDLPDCEVVAIAEIREKLGKKVAARYGIARVYRDHTELLANEKLDGIVASQPYNRHGVLLPDLYAAGVPVFTEKPLTCSLAVGEKILEALRKSKARHFVGYHKRSDPATVYARAEIDRLKTTKELGAFRYVRICMPPGDWVAAGFRHFLSSDDSMPALETDALPEDMDRETQEAYNAFVNYYIHQVNLMRHLLGEPYRVVYADPSQVLLVVQSESGITGVIEMAPYSTTIDWQEEALIAFEKGYIRLEPPAPLAVNRPGRVTLFRDPGDGAVPQTVIPQLPWMHAMQQQAHFFLRAIRGESTPLCEAAEALEDLRVAREYMRLLKGK